MTTDHPTREGATSQPTPWARLSILFDGLPYTSNASCSSKRAARTDPVFFATMTDRMTRLLTDESFSTDGLRTSAGSAISWNQPARLDNLATDCASRPIDDGSR